MLVGNNKAGNNHNPSLVIHIDELSGLYFMACQHAISVFELQGNLGAPPVQMTQ